MASLFASAVFILSALALAHHFGIPLDPSRIPQPLGSLLFLTSTSFLTVAYLKPLVLNLVAPASSDPTSTTRHDLAWLSVGLLGEGSEGSKDGVDGDQRQARA